jgi:hypothetical protein
LRRDGTKRLFLLDWDWLAYSRIDLCIHTSTLNLVICSSTAFNGNDKTGAVDYDSRRAVLPKKTIRGVDLVYFGHDKPSGAFGGTFSPS